MEPPEGVGIRRGVRTGSVAAGICIERCVPLSKRGVAQITERDWPRVVAAAARLGSGLLLLGLGHGPFHEVRSRCEGAPQDVSAADSVELVVGRRAAHSIFCGNHVTDVFYHV